MANPSWHSQIGVNI